MREIQYRVGDATAPASAGNKLICHVCNDMGGWGRGFVLALSKRSDTPERAYRAWHKHRGRNDFRPGSVLLVQVEPDTWVANMVATTSASAPKAAGRRSAMTRWKLPWARWRPKPDGSKPQCTCRESGAGSPVEPGNRWSRSSRGRWPKRTSRSGYMT